MTRIYHTIRQIFNGSRTIDDKTKYMAIGIVISFIHLVFSIAFYLLHIVPLYIYNIIVTIFYIYVGLSVNKKERSALIFMSAFVEILFHSTVVSVLLGWNWGFMIYTMSLIPISFYLVYTFPYFKESVSVPATSSAIVCICYIVVRVVTYHVPPVYSGEFPENVDRFFYYFNTIVALSMQLICAILFALEIRYMKRQMEQENKTLGEIANYDPLTHLLNRRSMNVYLKNALDQTAGTQDTFCLVLADIDDFKKVNDTYGHDCGDEVLIAVSRLISDGVREEDHVCRWGGEEILILLHADIEISTQVAERICKNIASTIVKYNDKEVSVTITMGISQYETGETIRSLIDRADRNLYYGKRNGKNQVVCLSDSPSAE